MDEAQIHDYLNGNLDEGALQEFEKRLQSDEDLARRVNEYRQLREMIPKAIAFDQEKAQVRAILEKASESSKPRSRFRWYALAAGLLVLASALFFIFQSQGACQNELAKELFAKQENPGFATTTMSAAGPEASTYEQGLVAFIRKDFAAADSIFQLLHASDSIYVRANILSGVIALKRDDYLKAIKYLETAEASSFGDIHAQWYLAIAYAMHCENEKARPLLDQLIKAQKGYHIKAAKLREEM